MVGRITNSRSGNDILKSRENTVDHHQLKTVRETSRLIVSIAGTIVGGISHYLFHLLVFSFG